MELYLTCSTLNVQLSLRSHWIPTMPMQSTKHAKCTQHAPTLVKSFICKYNLGNTSLLKWLLVIIRTSRRHWFDAAYRPACAVWWMAHDFGRLVRHIQLEGCYCCGSPAVRDLLLPEHFQLLGLERYVAQLNLRKFPALSFYTSGMGCNCWIRSIKDLWPCRARSSWIPRDLQKSWPPTLRTLLTRPKPFATHWAPR